MQEQQKTFTTQDGTALFYRYRPAADGSSDKAVLLFHRGHEHSGRMAHLVNELNLPDFDFFAWDARGHGDSPGERGDAPSFSACVKDIQSFVQHIEQQYAWNVGQLQSEFNIPSVQEMESIKNMWTSLLQYNNHFVRDFKYGNSNHNKIV